MRDIKLMIKHTFKETYKTMLLLNGIILGSLFLVALFILFFNASFFETPVGIFLIGIGAMLIVILMCAASIGILYTIFKSMNQKLFTNEGYLTFTLPVSVDSLIVSKVLVNLIWEILSVVVMIVGIGLIAGAALLKNAEEIILSGLFEYINISDIFEGVTALDVIGMIFSILIGLIIVIVALLFIFCILAFVNTGTLKKGKTTLAVVLYVFGIEILTSIITFINQFGAFGVTKDFITGKYKFSFGYTLETFYIINFTSLLTYGGSMVGLYFLARYLLKKKIELV